LSRDGIKMNEAIVAAWVCVWFLMSMLVGVGCAAIGLNVVLAVLIIITQASLCLISTLALSHFLDKK
jgi:hypothetical protein